MKVTFRPADASAALPRLVARVVEQDRLPEGLDPVTVEAAKASRFAGRPGQLHESFVGADGGVQRSVLLGIGEGGLGARSEALERAGAALVGRYLTSGEAAVALDLTGSTLGADETAALLLGAVLRAWRHVVGMAASAGDALPLNGKRQ